MRPDSPEYENDLKKKAREYLGKRDLDFIYDSFRKVVGTKEGRMVFAAILQKFPFDEDPFNPNSAQCAYNLGTQAISRWIRLELFERSDCEDLYFQMKKEVKAHNEGLEKEVPVLVDKFKKQGA